MLINNEPPLISAFRHTKYRLVIFALIAFGSWIPECRAQSALSNAPASTDLPEPARDAPKTAGKETGMKLTGDHCAGQLDAAQKTDCFARHSFSVGTLVGPLFMAVPEFAKPPARYPKDWRRGPGGFGRLYGDALAFQTVQQTSRFLTGLALHEDIRYHPAASRNPLCRAIHAITFAAFDRSDSDRTTLAASNLVSSAASGFVGTAYLPRGYNDTSHSVTRMSFQFGSIVLTNLVTEFKPELRDLGKLLHLPDHVGSRRSEKW